MEKIDAVFNFWLLLIPALTAFTGWLVIRLALYMIFKPVLPRNLIGIKIQGILPRYQRQIAAKAGEYAAASFSLDSIEEKIKDPRNFDQVKPLIEVHIDDFLRNKLKEQMPMISMFIGDKTIQSLKTIFIQEIEHLFPQVMTQFAGNLKKDLNIGEMVSSKLEAISPELIATAVFKKGNCFALYGALIGLLIGIVQFLIIWFI